MHPLDLEALGVAPGGTLTIASRRGEISLYARADDGMPRGAVFVPFCYYEAAANMLTNPVLDPFGKIPEFKYCAVKVTAGGDDARAYELRRRRDPRGCHGRRSPVIQNRECRMQTKNDQAFCILNSAF